MTDGDEVEPDAGDDSEAQAVLEALRDADLANLTPAQLLAQLEDWQQRLADDDRQSK